MANKRAGGRIQTENDPLDPAPPKAMKQTVEAIRQLEAMVPAAPFITGIVLRYGSFDGPGTRSRAGGTIVEVVRHRKYPIFGSGFGVWSFMGDYSVLAMIPPPGSPSYDKSRYTTTGGNLRFLNKWRLVRT